MKRMLPFVAAMLVSACSAERLTGPAAQEAVAKHQSRATAAADIVYFLDGREISAKDVESLDSQKIESVEVIKGEAARRLLGDRQAVGIVMITSKPAASR